MADTTVTAAWYVEDNTSTPLARIATQALATSDALGEGQDNRAKATLSLRALGEAGGEAESSLRAIGGVLGLVSPGMERAVAVAAELGGGLEGLSKGVSLVSSRAGTLAPLLLAVGGSLTAAGLAAGLAAAAIVGTVSAADDLARALEPLRDVEGFGIDPGDIAALEEANAAMEGVSATAQQLVVVLGTEFAPVVRAGAEVLIKMGLVAVDVFRALTDGRDVLVSVAEFAGREFVQALLKPVDVLAHMIDQLATLAKVAGQDGLAAQLEKAVASWDAFATSVARRGATVVGSGIGSALEMAGLDLANLDDRAEAIIGKLTQIRAQGSGGGGAAPAQVAVAQGPGTGEGLTAAIAAREVSDAFRILSERAAKLGVELPVDQSYVMGLALGEQIEALRGLTSMVQEAQQAEQERSAALAALAEQQAAALAQRQEAGAGVAQGLLTGSLSAALGPVLSALGPQGAVVGAVLSLLEQGPEQVKAIALAIPEALGNIVDSIASLPELAPDLIDKLIKELPGVLITLLIQQSGILAIQLVTALIAEFPALLDSSLQAVLALITDLPALLFDVIELPRVLAEFALTLPFVLVESFRLILPELKTALRDALRDSVQGIIREIRALFRSVNPFGKQEGAQLAGRIGELLRIDVKLDGRLVGKGLAMARSKLRGGADG